MKNMKMVSITISVLLAVFIGGIYLFENNKSSKINNTNSSSDIYKRDYSVNFGENKKNITVVEFIDPECAPCKQFYPIVNAMYKEYYDEISLVIKYLPNHRNSSFVVKILEASRYQNKYKEVLDVVFDKQDDWSGQGQEKADSLWKFLRVVDGLDIKKLKTDMNNPKIQEIIDQDKKDARVLGVRGTPTVFVNSKRLSGLSYPKLMDLVENEIYK